MQWAREDLPERASLCWDLNSRLDFDRDRRNDGRNSLIKSWEMARTREIKGRAKGFERAQKLKGKDQEEIGAKPRVLVRGGFILG